MPCFYNYIRQLEAFRGLFSAFHPNNLGSIYQTITIQNTLVNDNHSPLLTRLLRKRKITRERLDQHGPAIETLRKFCRPGQRILSCSLTNFVKTSSP